MMAVLFLRACLKGRVIMTLLHGLISFDHLGEGGRRRDAGREARRRRARVVEQVADLRGGWLVGWLVAWWWWRGVWTRGVRAWCRGVVERRVWRGACGEVRVEACGGVRVCVASRRV